MELNATRGTKMKGIAHISQAVLRGSMIALFFLVPPFFLPWSTSILELNKQLLLLVLTVVALIAWVGSMVGGKEVVFRRGWLNVLPIAFFASVLVSSVVSLSGYQSWVGLAGSEYVSFLTVLLFTALFYLLLHAQDRRLIGRRVLFALLASSALMTLVTLGGILDIFHLPFAFAQARHFNTIGTTLSFQLFLIVVSYLGMALWIVDPDGKGGVMPAGKSRVALKAVVGFLIISNLLLVFISSVTSLLVLNITGAILLATFVMLRKKEFPRPYNFIWPFLVFVISGFFLVPFISRLSPIRVQLPAIVSPTMGMSMDISWKTVRKGVVPFMFGTGPGTWAIDYGLYRDQAVNQSQLWGVRFDRARSHFLTMVGMYGVLGTLLWIAFMAAIAAKALSRLLKQEDHEGWKMTYVLFVGWALLLVSQFLFSSNISLSFLLFGLSGLLAAEVGGMVDVVSFGRSPRLGLISSFGFVLLVVLAVFGVFVSAQRYVAELAYGRALKKDQAQASVDDVLAEIAKASTSNPFSDEYQRSLASALLLKAQKVLADSQKLTGDEAQKQTAQLGNIVQAAVASAMRATAIEPKNVLNYSTEGSIYRDIMPLVQGADVRAIERFERAAELEPMSPAHPLNLGRTHLMLADRQQVLAGSEDKPTADDAKKKMAEELSAAEASFNKAIQLKPDFAPAHYYLAATYERQNKLADAAARLQALRQVAPADLGLGLQFALLEIRLEKYDVAEAELKRLIALNKDYANAHWYLSVVYEKQGKKDLAIQEVNLVAGTNKDNPLVKQRVAQLKGAAPVELPVSAPLPPPVEQGAEQAATSPQPGGEIEEPVPASTPKPVPAPKPAPVTP
ncbi:tetratricopeptide repeat protein [Candidatus Uhrbacteria bacterium]|nr:tetratricopeptide repeat protein [Candidatus Uhrbacteria bacterium]